MAGPQRAILGVFVLSLVVCGPVSVRAQSRDPVEPIRGITFDPPRSATLRHKAGNVIRGDLLAISPEQVQFRLQSGKVLLYELREIRSIMTRDRGPDFRYNAAYDTYRKLVENARGLPGVTIEDVAVATNSGGAPQVPTPPEPPLPVVIDSPDNYAPSRIDASTGLASAAGTDHQAGGELVAGQMPPVPQQIPANQPTTNAGLANVPVYETDAFKIGFLVACFVVILLWWRNRVG